MHVAVLDHFFFFPRRTRTDSFDWDEYRQNVVLGAYAALNVFTQLPGGVLGRRYGSKLVFRLSNGPPAFIPIAVPASAKTSYELLVAVRLVQGAIAQSIIPSIGARRFGFYPHIFFCLGRFTVFDARDGGRLGPGAREKPFRIHLFG